MPVIPPVLVKREAMVGTGFFPEAEAQVYALGSDDLFLVGTAEVPLASMHGGETLAEADLPLHYVGFSTCFRREAGAAGKDTRGIFRVHQFDKLELFSYCHPDTSWDEHERLLAIEEEIAQELGFHYQVVDIPAGDLGASAARKYDIEVWLPGQAPLPRADVVLELHRLPGPPPEHPLPRRRRQAPVRAHAERHRDHVEPHAARADRVRPARGRLDRDAGGAAPVRRARPCCRRPPPRSPPAAVAILDRSAGWRSGRTHRS